MVDYAAMKRNKEDLSTQLWNDLHDRLFRKKPPKTRNKPRCGTIFSPL